MVCVNCGSESHRTVRQGFALTATTTIAAGAPISFGITRAINYLFLRDEENRTDSFAFFGIEIRSPVCVMLIALPHIMPLIQ